MRREKGGRRRGRGEGGMERKRQREKGGGREGWKERERKRGREERRENQTYCPYKLFMSKSA